MINSKRKGAAGERELAAELNRLFPTLHARRGQQFKGGEFSPDVEATFPGTHCEVKRVQALNIYAAMQQAIDDAGPNVPYVAHRRNRADWLITCRLDDLRAFAAAVCRVTESEKTLSAEQDASDINV